MDEINLKQIIREFPDCVTNGAKLKSILLDLHPTVSMGEINVMGIIANCGIASEIMKSTNVDKLQKEVWVKRLFNDYCLNEQMVNKCLTLWCEAFNSINKDMIDKELYNSAVVYIKQAYESEPNAAVENYIHALECFEKIEFGTIIYKHRIDKILKKMFRICRLEFEISPHNYFLGIEKCEKYAYETSATSLGNCLKYGIGTEINIKKAISSYRASRQKDINAIIELGDCWQNGIGVKQSFDYAIHEYESAATLGSEQAQKLIIDIKTISQFPYYNYNQYTLRDNEEKNDGFIFDGNILKRYVGNKSNVVVPTHITKINTLAFAGCDCIEAVTIGQNVESIGDGAFAGCKNLKSVKILSNKIYALSRRAFYACTNLEKLELPETITILESFAFGWCVSLKNIKIPNSVERIENKCFIGCRSLEKIVLPYSLKELGFGVFFLCVNLNTVEYVGEKSTWNVITGVRRITNNRLDNFLFTLPELISSNETCEFILKKDLPSDVKNEIHLLNTKIEELNFTTRTENALRRAGIQTLQDIVSRSKCDLEKVRNLGAKGQMEVFEKVSSLQLSMLDK